MSLRGSHAWRSPLRLDILRGLRLSQLSFQGAFDTINSHPLKDAVLKIMLCNNVLGVRSQTDF